MNKLPNSVNYEGEPYYNPLKDDNGQWVSMLVKKWSDNLICEHKKVKNDCKICVEREQRADDRYCKEHDC